MPPVKDLFAEITTAFKKRDQKKLRKINDRILKSAVLEFNKQIYDVAVISYVLNKITSKPRFQRKELETKMANIDKMLSDITKAIERLNETEWNEAFQKLHDKIKDLESDDPRFIRDLMNKGKMKVAATLYAQGLSLGLACEMTGMNKQEILDYAGKTMMFDRIKEEQSIQERMKNARRLVER